MKHAIAKSKAGKHRDIPKIILSYFYPAIFYLTVFVLTGCEAVPSSRKQEASEFFIAAVWNVQALFDGQETGNEYGEYREAAGWTEEKYKARITAISQAVLRMVRKETSLDKAVPDLIGFVELENQGILADLSRSELSKHGYYWNAYANLPGYSLGIGVLSRIPLKDIKAHSITAEKETAPRPVLELKVESRGKPLIFFLCHWKSKLGGEVPTEVLRRASARVVQRRLRELKESEPQTPVSIMGDLNENHDEFYRFSGKVVSALLPDAPDAAALALTTSLMDEVLVLSGETKPEDLHGSSFIPDLAVNDLADLMMYL